MLCAAFLNPATRLLSRNPVLFHISPALSWPGTVRTIATSEADHFKLKPDALEKALTPRSKVLIICYPNNPTGAVMTRKELQDVAQIAEKHDLLVIADEIYSELTYKGEHTSFASLPGMKERAILINGFRNLSL